MKILNFALNFPDEDTCRMKFKEQRDQIGVVCRHCNCKEHYWLENKQAYECKNAMHGRIYVQAQSCSTPTYPIGIGLQPCT